MIFTVGTEELQNSMGLLGSVAKVNTAEKEGRVLIETMEEGKVELTAVTSTTSMTLVMSGVDVEEHGSACVLYGKLKSFVNSFAIWDGESGVKEFTFRLDDSGLSITVENKYFGGNSSSGEVKLDYFNTYTIVKPDPFKKATFVLNSTIISTAINKIMYSISTTSDSKYLRGMQLSFDGDNIRFVGSNGTKLSEFIIDNISDIKTGEYIISADFLSSIRRCLKKDSQVFFEVDRNNIKAKFNNMCLYGKLIIGEKWPEYIHYFDNYENTVTLDKEVLISTIRPFMVFLNQGDHNRLRLSFKDKKMSIINDYATFIYDGDIGYGGEFVIDVNGNFLMQTIDAIKDDKILIKFKNSESPLILDSGNYQNQKALVSQVKFNG